MLLGMVSYFAGVVQAPITAFVIVIEMSDNHAMVVPLMAAALIAYATSRLVCPEGIYHALAMWIRADAFRRCRRPLDAKGEMTRGKLHSLKRPTLSWNTAALLVYNCCLLHIRAAKLARFKSDFDCGLSLRGRCENCGDQHAFIRRMRADRALHRSGGLNIRSNRSYLTILRSDVGSLGLIDFAKCLSRRVRGHDGRAHANLRLLTC